MRKLIYIELIVICLLLFGFSGGLLIEYYTKDYQAQSAYEDLSDMVEQVRQELPTENSTVPGEPVQPTLVEVTDPQTGEVRMVLPEYAKLYTMNTDVIGWIRIDGMKVDYPVMHCPEKTDYYLKRDFYKKRSSSGSIYIREECDAFKPSDNITIYGHRMNSGAMFGELMNYKEADFWKNNRYIRFDNLSQRHTYEIFSVFRIDASFDNGFQYHTFVDMSQDQFAEFVTQCKDRAMYDTGITPEYGDKLITLSTCEKGTTNVRLVIVARRIS